MYDYLYQIELRVFHNYDKTCNRNNKIDKIVKIMMSKYDNDNDKNDNTRK